MLARIKALLRKLSIKTKLIIFMTTLIVITSLFNLYFYYKAYYAMDEFNAMLKDYSQVNTLSIKLIDGRDCISRYILSKDPAELKTYTELSREVNALARAENETSSSQNTFLWSKAIVNTLGAYNQEIKLLFALRPESDSYNTQFTKVKTIATYLESYSKQLLDIKLTEGEWTHQRLIKRVAYFRFLNLVSVIGIVIFSLVFVYILSQSITGPIQKLTRFSMNIAQGNFDTKKLAVDSSEDINILASAFNKMAQSIQDTIQLERKLHEEEYKNLKIAEQLNEAKFLALQSQINPHFLFNTLNAIMRMTMFEKAPKSSDLIESLSRIFRYNLGSTHKEVLLQEELDIIKEYISIQQARFGERIGFEIVARTDIADIEIPRFTIQPLIENAIIHGLEPKETGGMVRIKIYRRMGEVVIKIVDNGIGMSKARIAAIISGSEHKLSRGHTTSIGIINVLERIGLYCKDKQCFSIHSKEGLGTVVVIRIRQGEVA